MNYSPNEPITTPLEHRIAQLQSLTLHDVMFWVRKWKWEFLAVTSATILATLLYIMIFRDPAFVSEARLFVRLSQEQTAPRTLVTQEGTTLLTPATSDVTSEIDLFLNSDLANQVIDTARLLEAMETPRPPPETVVDHLKAAYRSASESLRSSVDEVAYALGVKVRLTPREALIRQIRMSLGVENSRGSNVVVVSVTWPDRDVPKALLQYYIDAFMTFRLNAFQGGDTAYFERQAELARARVNDLESRIVSLRTGSGIEDVTVQRGLLIGAREQALSQIHDIEQSLARIRTRMTALEARGDAGAALVLADLPDNPILRLLDERSIALRDERLRLQSQPSLDGAALAALDQSFASLTQSTLLSIRDHEARITEDLADAKAGLAETDARLAALSENEAEWNALRVELDLAAETYEDTARRLSEARRAEDLHSERISNVVIIQEPTEPHLATGTRNAVVLGVGGVFALLLAASWVVLREALDSRVWRPQDIKEINGVSLLGTTRRRWRRPVREDMALTAASIGSVCVRRGYRSIAYMAVSKESHSPALRTCDLAKGLRSMGLAEVQIINAGRWDNGKAALDPTASVSVRNMTPDDLMKELATLSDDDSGAFRVIATPPLFSSVHSMKIAWTVDAVVFDIAAGSEDLANVEAAARWIKLNNARSVGMILADARTYAVYGPAVTV